jgi:hypothetical protein
MNTFTVNNKEYNAKPFDFNMICDMEDLGISMEQMTNKPLSMVRAYFSFHIAGGKEVAGKEIEQHIINGGDFNDIIEAMSKEMENSDFFQALSKTAAEETTESQTAETTKK